MEFWKMKFVKHWAQVEQVYPIIILEYPKDQVLQDHKLLEECDLSKDIWVVDLLRLLMNDLMENSTLYLVPRTLFSVLKPIFYSTMETIET